MCFSSIVIESFERYLLTVISFHGEPDSSSLNLIQFTHIFKCFETCNRFEGNRQLWTPCNHPVKMFLMFCAHPLSLVELKSQSSQVCMKLQVIGMKTLTQWSSGKKLIEALRMLPGGETSRWFSKIKDQKVNEIYSKHLLPVWPVATWSKCVGFFFCLFNSHELVLLPWRG